jgi:2,4-dienoyl-CoA reductase-like NADH-dependent reductase (Old Yellow Enzyme family)
MHRSTPGNPRGVGELCRLAEELFDALRKEFDIDSAVSVRLSRPEDLVEGAHLGHRELAMIGVRCAQLLNSVGYASAAIDHDETIALLNVLDVVLRRLLRNRKNGSRAVVELRRIHREVADIGLLMTATAALDGTGPEQA